MPSITPRSVTSLALLDRLKRCDACGTRASAPILRWVDFDAVSLHCEQCALALETSFTSERAVQQVRTLLNIRKPFYVSR